MFSTNENFSEYFDLQLIESIDLESIGIKAHCFYDYFRVHNSVM